MMKIINIKKLNLYIIVGIVFVLVFGVTYAYFNVTLRNATEPTQMVTETGTLELNYIDGDYVTGENIYPGWRASKTIIVTNVGSLDAYYKIFWKELTNNFEQNELVLRAVCTSYEHYGEANQVISGACNDIEETPVANVASSIKENIGVEVGFTHVYSFTFTFKEMSSLQNYNQGKTFGGVLNIDDSYGLYTMNGTLLDEEGNPLASTLVSLSNGKSATTNAQGKFTIEEVDEGSYQLTIGEVTNSLTLETGRELGASENTITSNIENKEINVTIQLGNDSITYDVTEPTSYDLNMLALYVDGVKVTSLNENSYYLLSNYTCTNGETVTWKNYNNQLTVSPMTSATRCTINFEEKTEEEMFDYGTIADAHVNNVTEGYYSSNYLNINGSEAFCRTSGPDNFFTFTVTGNFRCYSNTNPRSYTAGGFNTSERINPIENSANLANVNQGLNSYTFTSSIPANYTAWFFVYSGNSVGTMHYIGSFKLLINGSYYTLKQAVTNGYIKPIVVMYSGREKDYYFPNMNNLYDGGNTGNGHYAYAYIFFMTNVEITGAQFYSSTSYVNANDRDGFRALITPIDNYRMTLNGY